MTSVKGALSSPVGRVVVKDAWHARRETANDRVVDAPAGSFWKTRDELFDPCTSPSVKADDGEIYRADRKGGLFVMMKLDPATRGTDHGWIYGTVSTSGQVTTAGLVEECVSCHESAPFDHIFSSGR